MDDLAPFLSTVGITQGLEPAQIRMLAGACVEHSYQAGAHILKQGAQNSTLYFLRTGTLAVRTGPGSHRVTVAHLEPPAVVGEVSFATGRTCSADIDVVIDATLVALTLDALDRFPVERSHLLRGLMAVVAERLHTTMTRGMTPTPRPIVLLHQSRAWAAPRVFPVALADALARELDIESLVVHIEHTPSAVDPNRVGDRVWQVGAGPQNGGALRTTLAGQLTSWTTRFGALVLNCDASHADARDDIGALATHQVWLLGPGEAVSATVAPEHFIVQDASGPTLPCLSARRRLADVSGAERTLQTGGETPPSLGPAVDAVARGITGRQIGLALGGGGAWGWAHLGVLEVLEQAAVPVDAVAGCSMGSLVGGLRASGASIAELHAVAEYWKRHHRTWSELRFWRLHVANERRIANAFRQLFGDRRLERFVTPFWANAIDIESGEEVSIKDGSLVDAVRASMAFPGWTPPVQRGDRLLVDAALIDPVPSALVRQMHCDRIIAVNTLGPMTPHKLESRLPRQAYDVIDRYVRLAAHEVGRIHGEVAGDVTISPAVGDTTMLSFNRSDELIDAGRRAAEERLPLIREVIARRATP